MDPKLIAAFILVLGIAVILAAVTLARGGDGDGDNGAAIASPAPIATDVPAATPSLTSTLETAPGVTPTPSGPEQEARNLTLVEAPAGLLQFVESGPYVVPGDAQGLFYVDIETQRFEGWYELVKGTQPVASSGDNRFTVFERREQAFQGGTAYPAGRYLADRETRKVYRWEGGAELVMEEMSYPMGEITSRGDLILFRVPAQDDDDWFALLDVAKNEVVRTFRAAAQWALISEDATRIALAGPDVLVVDAGTGEVEGIAQGVLADVDLEGEVELINARDGGSFMVVTKPAKLRFRGVALRYTWDGDLLSEVTGIKVFPSPGGDFVAVAEPVVVQEEEPAPAIPWFSVRAYATADGSEQFRVVGVLPDYGFNAGNRWLAGGSGLALQRPPYTLMFAMRDGSFRDFLGVPSPEPADVFARVGAVGAAVVDPDGTPLLTLSFLGGARDLFDPWGDRGDEVRVLVPHGGHGGPGLAVSIVEPYVEQPPYDQGTPLQISAEAVVRGLIDLYDEPAGTVIGRVAPPYRVTVHEVARRCSGDFQTYGPAGDCPPTDLTVNKDFLAAFGVPAEEIAALLYGLWARVTAPDGQEGWVLLEAGRVGI